MTSFNLGKHRPRGLIAPVSGAELALDEITERPHLSLFETRPLRVAIVVEAAGGGVAVHVSDLIDGLVKKGVEVHLIAPRGNRFDTNILTVECVGQCKSVVRIPMRRAISWRDAVTLAHIWAHLIRIAPDIVHSHSSKAGALARSCRGSWRHVYTPHALYTLNPHLARLPRFAISGIERLCGSWLTDQLIAVSVDEAIHAQQKLGLPRRKVTVIHNGVPQFSRLSRSAARAALGLTQDGFTVGFVGRFSFQKGLDRLMNAADLLLERFGTELDIAVIGAGDIEVVSGRSRFDRPLNVHLVGQVVDARRYFHAFDILILPSRYEGFPYVFLEAMAAGLPIVTTRVAGAQELVAAEEIGVVVDNDDDVRSLVDAIGFLFLNQDMRNRLRANCDRAVRRFSATRMISDTLKVYRKTVSSNIQ